jgi:hypothetical protein
MSGFVRLKNELIKHLVSLGVTNFRVMDSCCVTSVSTTSPINERLNELKKVTNSDGIHFTADGHKNMASRVTDCLKTLINKPTKPMKQTTYFWRGFAAAEAHPFCWHARLARWKPYAGRLGGTLTRRLSEQQTAGLSPVPKMVGEIVIF